MKMIVKLAGVLKKVGGILCITGAAVLIFLLVTVGLVSQQTFSRLVPWLFPWVFGFPGGALLMVLGSTLSERLRRPSAENALYERIIRGAEFLFQTEQTRTDGKGRERVTVRRFYRTQGGRFLEKREETVPGKADRSLAYRYLTEEELKALRTD